MSGTGQLGLVSGPRNTKDGREFNHLIKKVAGKDLFLKDGSVNEVVEACVDIVAAHYLEVEDLAKMLKGPTLKETCANIFDFAYPYLQYRLDKPGVEQLRTPARSWYDGQIRFKQNEVSDAGIDCDDFSIFCGSLLKCLDIPFKFRITEYENKGYYQHIYVFVPCAEDTEGEIIIDPVLSKFDYQKPYSAEKSDFNMKPIAMAGLSGFDLSGVTGLGMPIMMLSGVDDADDDLMGIISGIDFDNAINGLGSADDATLNYLKRTQRYIIANPNSVSHIQNPKQFLQMINSAIINWNTVNRDKVLDKLIEIESDLIDGGFIKMDSDALEGLEEMDDELLGRASRSQRRARRKRRRKAFFHSVKKAAKKVGNGLKVAAKAVVRFNPLSIAIRSGLLVALRLNMFKYSSKLKYAYLPDNLASQYNINHKKLAEIKRAHSKLKKIFKGLQGKESKLKTAILKGAKETSKNYSLNGVNELEKELEMLRGLGELGDPVTAASVGAASGILAKIGSFLRPIKNIFNTAKTDTQSSRASVEPLIRLPAITPEAAARAMSPSLVVPYSRSTAIQPTDQPILTAQVIKKSSSRKKMMIFGGLGILTIAGVVYYASTKKDETPEATDNSKAKPKRSLGSLDLK